MIVCVEVCTVGTWNFWIIGSRRYFHIDFRFLQYFTQIFGSYNRTGLRIDFLTVTNIKEFWIWWLKTYDLRWKFCRITGFCYHLMPSLYTAFDISNPNVAELLLLLKKSNFFLYIISVSALKVLKEKSFLKKTKLAFFNKHTLTQLAHLYVQIQNKGDNERTELHEEINVLVMEMLEVICTDSTFGILFPNKQGIFAGR